MSFSGCATVARHRRSVVRLAAVALVAGAVAAPVPANAQHGGPTQTAVGVVRPTGAPAAVELWAAPNNAPVQLLAGERQRAQARGDHAWLGAGIGLVVGAVGMAVVTNAKCKRAAPRLDELGCKMALTLNPVAGGVVGLFVGGVVGRFIPRGRGPTPNAGAP